MLRRKVLMGTSLILLAACGGSDGGSKTPALMPPGGVLFSYAPGGEPGACRPERTDLADIGSTDLYSIRGRSVFQMPTGQTRIPFQSVHKYPDDKGFSEDTSTTILNQPGDCDQLEITVVIESCEFNTPDGRREGPCPAMAVSGLANFKDIDIVREDQ